jgi:hypothetical protein
LIAFAIRARRGVLLIGVWFVAYLLTKGTYIPASVEDASFWRIMMPAFPAYLILAAAVVLLVPGARPRAEAPAPASTKRRFTLALGIAAAVFALLPLGVVAATPRLHDHGRQAVRLSDNLVPVSSIDLRATTVGNAVKLSWRRQTPGGSVFYRVMRTNQPDGGVGCAGKPTKASDDCELVLTEVKTTARTVAIDHPGPGTWQYRVGVAANWLDDQSLGDVYVVSPPAGVTLR